jgi:predicted GNAT superfamily acetyltransferase
VLHRKAEVLAGTFVQRAAFVPVVHNDFTMVRRSARGQRLALGLKRRLLDQLEKDGLERVTTEVRTDNPAMLAVNTSLGFRRIGMRHITSGRDLA